MARMTAEDMVRFVRKAMGKPTTDEWNNNDILRLINQAQLKIVTSHWREMPDFETSTDVTTTSGTSEYELSVSDFIRETAVLNVTDGIRMKPSNRSDYTHMTQGTSTVAGEVIRYFFTGLGSNSRKSVILWPQPNKTVTIRIWYIKKPDELVLSPSATSSELPEEWDEAIIQKAAEIGLAIDNQARFPGDAEARANEAKPKAAEKRWGIASTVAKTVMNRTRRNRR